MPGTGQCAAAICAPLRLLVNTRDDAALWLLLQSWRFPASACSAAPFGTALRDAAIKSRLSPYQQLLTWARRGIYGEDMTPAEVSCARRLIAAIDALQDKLEAAALHCSGEQATSLLNSLLGSWTKVR